jgi:PadR family transcriptional regulator, regulatory protein PadR
MKADQVKGHLELLVLAALAEGDAHGYVLIERLRARSAGEFALAEGTIYPALHRLESAGLLRSRWDVRSPRRRRVYALTRNGRKALEEQRAAWRTFARAVERVVGGAA